MFNVVAETPRLLRNIIKLDLNIQLNSPPIPIKTKTRCLQSGFAINQLSGVF